jgi:hypothetical protein
MPLNKKGREIEGAMEKEYGEKKGKSVFYASINKGKIKGAEGKEHEKKHKGRAKEEALERAKRK